MRRDGEAFVQATSRIQSANCIASGTHLARYTAELADIDETVQLITLAGEVADSEAAVGAFDKVVSEWESASANPNIVTVLTRGTAPCPWVAIPDTTDSTLANLQGTLSPTEIEIIVTDTAEALRTLGLYNLVHGSLSPSDIHIVPDGADTTVGVANFGLEQAVQVAVDEFTPTPYTAPELVEAPANQSVRTDVYGLGAITYFALTGQHPVTGTDLADVIRDGAIDPPSTHEPDISSRLDDVILQALAPDLDDRQDSPYEFMRAFVGAFDVDEFEEFARQAANTTESASLTASDHDGSQDDIDDPSNNGEQPRADATSDGDETLEMSARGEPQPEPTSEPDTGPPVQEADSDDTAPAATSPTSSDPDGTQPDTSQEPETDQTGHQHESNGPDQESGDVEAGDPVDSEASHTATEPGADESTQASEGSNTDVWTSDDVTGDPVDPESTQESPAADDSEEPKETGGDADETAAASDQRATQPDSTASGPDIATGERASPAGSSMRQSIDVLKRNPELFGVGLVYSLILLPQTALTIFGVPFVPQFLQVATFFVTPFVLAGLLGMAHQGQFRDASFETFATIGKSCYVSLLGGQLLKSIFTLLFSVISTGVVLIFILVTYGATSGASSPSESAALLVLGLIGFLIFLFVLISFFIQFFPAAIVADNVGATDGFKRSIGFVKANFISSLGYGIVNFTVILATSIPLVIAAAGAINNLGSSVGSSSPVSGPIAIILLGYFIVVSTVLSAFRGAFMMCFYHKHRPAYFD